MFYRTAPFSMTLNEPKPRFQGQAILWRWISPKWLQIRWNHESSWCKCEVRPVHPVGESCSPLGQRLHFCPVTPGRQTHRPVICSQSSRNDPRLLQLHATTQLPFNTPYRHVVIVSSSPSSAASSSSVTLVNNLCDCCIEDLLHIM